MNRNRNSFFYSLSSRSKRLLLIIILFFASVLLFISNYNETESAKRIRAISSQYSYLLSSTLTTPINMLMNGYDKIDDIKKVYLENERLKGNQLAESISFQEIISMKLKLEKYESLLNLFDENDYSFSTARVISNISNNYINTIIVKSGSKNGIKTGMPIIGLKGLVGFIDEVRNNTSVGILLTNINSRIPVSISKNSYQAIMMGQDFNRPKIIFAKEKRLIKVGDLVSTSGKGGIYPPYILVGKIINIEEDNVEVQLFEDIDSLSHVRLIGFNQNTVE